MDFFKKLFFREKTYTKYGDVLKKRVTTKEQRLEALEVLEKAPPQQSVPEILKRFELVVESGLQDTKEKEQCLNAIIKHGPISKPFVIEYIQTKKRLAWVLRIAERILSKDEYLDLLLANLKTDGVEFDDDIIERNLDILHVLKDIQNPKITPQVVPFLDNRDDDTRLTALECLEFQGENDPNARQIILNLAQTPITDVNSRFMGAVNNIIQKHHWLNT